jgi:glycosyltransferase involved in cell wall biosynthesis
MGARRTVHLVYPHGERISAPDSIGREVGRRLEVSYDVVYHDWASRERIAPGRGDVLVGHPHPSPGTCFRTSLQSPGWRRTIALSPFNHDPAQVGFLDRIVPRVDAYLAITGSYWFDSIDRSAFAHWLPKMTHVDMAIDPNDYPPIKAVFSPPGDRRFVYIGHSGWQKNTAYLSDIAARMPGVRFDWIGSGDAEIAGFTRRGPLDFSAAEARRAVAEEDFLITVGLFDANPTTVLEAMGWGLIPICTPQSGYHRNPGIVNIPADDAAEAAAILEDLNRADGDRLSAIQQANRAQLTGHFNWDRFAVQVEQEIESTAVRSMGPESTGRRFLLRWSELTSPYSPFSARAMRRGLARMRRPR